MTCKKCNDSIAELYQSTLDLYARFDVIPDRENTLFCFDEEVDEFIGAFVEYDPADHIAEEAADVFVTTIGMCIAAGISAETLMARVRYVIDKNNAKTHDTHHVNGYGKIARK